MKMYRDGIVRNVSNERIHGMKKQGWMELGEDGKPIPNASNETEAKIKELKTALEEKEAKIVELESTKEIPDTVMGMLQLYAKEKGYDTGSATSESGVLTKIIEAEKV